MAKAIKLSKRDQTLIDSLDIGTESEVVKNSWSGNSCTLDARGVALHDFIKGSEALNLYNKLEQGLRLFRKLYPSEYMTLLD